MSQITGTAPQTSPCSASLLPALSKLIKYCSGSGKLQLLLPTPWESAPSWNFGGKKQKPKYREAWKHPGSPDRFSGDSLVSALHPDPASPGNWAKFVCYTLPRTGTQTPVRTLSPSGALPHLCTLGEIVCKFYPKVGHHPQSPIFPQGHFSLLLFTASSRLRASKVPYTACPSSATIHCIV